jgi:hypothetical protein
MEYKFDGTSSSKRAEDKSFALPARWLVDVDSWVFVYENHTLRLYPYEIWLNIRSLKDDDGKRGFDINSSRARFKRNKELKLPHLCNWLRVDLVGMGEYIIIKESTSSVILNESTE